MGKTTYLVIVLGLLLVATGILKLVYRSSSHARPSEPNSSRDRVVALLQTHGGGNDKDWTRFLLKGTLRYYPYLTKPSQQFERKLILATDGLVFRYEKTTQDVNQSYLFDGNTVVQIISQTETRLEVKALEGEEASGIKSLIAGSGPLPILKRLSDPALAVVYLGPTSKGDRFEVKAAKESWYFYSNSNHLIERVERGEINITYGDYRTVGGLTLPYYQSVRQGETFLYDIQFDSFELNPVFPAGFFKR
jgi:hypothetical protein